MRVIFMGTPEFSVPVFTALKEAGHDIVAVYTRAPRPAGRGKALRKSPVHLAAERDGIAVLTPRTLRDADVQRRFSSHEADVAVVVAYGLLLPASILNAPAWGCLNLHGSALPRWRGAAPIQRAIMAGDSETAVQVMAMDEGLDTGAICQSETIPIPPDMTAGELHDLMSVRGAALMVRALEELAAGRLRFFPQSDQGITYAAKIEKSETRIDWTRPAEEVHNHVRGLSPFPGAWDMFELNGARVRVKVLRTVPDAPRTTDVANPVPGQVLDADLRIACGRGVLKILRVQRAGRGSMDTPEFIRGAGDLTGTIVGEG